MEILLIIFFVAYFFYCRENLNGEQSILLSNIII